MKSKIKRKLLVLMVLVLVFCSVSTVAYAETDLKTGIAVVTGSKLRLRTDANLFSSVIDYAEKDDFVVVIDKVGKWYKVNYNLQSGYMHEDYLSFKERENAELGYGKVCGTNVNLRTGPSIEFRSLNMLNTGDLVYIIGINNGWYKVVFENSIGYMRSDYVELTEIPYDNYDSTVKPLFFKHGDWICDFVDTSLIKRDVSNKTEQEKSENATLESTKNNIVEIAEQYLGVPYVWGGKSPSGFDCSGFVYYVFGKAGYSVPRTASMQYPAGTPVDKENLQAGDLVFFQNTYEPGISHVGIYVGNNKFIHSPSTGNVVSYADLNSNYYSSHYYGACRIAK